MRIEDRIALGSAPEATLAEVDHATLVRAKSSGRQVVHGVGNGERDGEVYWFTLSTEQVNRRGDIIRQKGLDFSNWLRTPVVLHNHDDEWPVGLGTVKRVNGETRMGVQFSSVNPRAIMLKAMLDEGMPMAASISILPRKVHDPRDAKERQTLGLGPYGVVYEKAEMVEGSIVTVPADPAAIRNALQGKADAADVDRFVETLAATEMDLAKRLRSEPEEQPEGGGDEPPWASRLEAALDRCAARIEQAVRSGVRREPAGSSTTTPSAARGINLSQLLEGIDARMARKDDQK